MMSPLVCFIMTLIISTASTTTQDVLTSYKNEGILLQLEDHMDSMVTSLKELIAINRDVKVTGNEISHLGSDGNVKLDNVITVLTSLSEKLTSLEKNRCADYTLEILESVKNSCAAVEQNFKKQSIIDCKLPFKLIEGSCIMVDFTQTLTWHKARVYCNKFSGDLAVFKDANMYAATVSYLKQTNSGNEKLHVWIGGSDIEKENVWLWVNGEAMPRGTPFWGSRDGYKSEPGNGVAGNCAFLYFTDGYYIHDVGCDSTTTEWQASPLCQYIP